MSAGRTSWVPFGALVSGFITRSLQNSLIIYSAAIFRTKATVLRHRPKDGCRPERRQNGLLDKKRKAFIFWGSRYCASRVAFFQRVDQRFGGGDCGGRRVIACTSHRRSRPPRPARPKDALGSREKSGDHHVGRRSGRNPLVLPCSPDRKRKIRRPWLRNKFYVVRWSRMFAGLSMPL